MTGSQKEERKSAFMFLLLRNSRKPEELTHDTTTDISESHLNPESVEVRSSSPGHDGGGRKKRREAGDDGEFLVST